MNKVCSLTAEHSFYNRAHKKVKHLEESFTKMEDAYREACLMFCESPKNTDPADFFGLFKNFVTEWKVLGALMCVCVCLHEYSSRNVEFNLLYCKASLQ